LQFGRENVRALEGDLVRERFGLPGLAYVLSRGWLVWPLAEVGEFGEGIVHGAEAIRIAEGSITHSPVWSPRTILAVFTSGKGDLEKAISCSSVTSRSAKFAASRISPPGSPPTWALAYAVSGRLAEALPLLEQAVDRATSMGLVTDLALRGRPAGRGLPAGGASSRRDGLAKRALELSRKHKERGNEAWVLRLLAEIASRHDPPEIETAQDHYRQALILAEELGMRPLVAHCQLGLGKLYRKTGRREQAREHLTTATTMYREMDMRFWPEQARQR